MTVKTCMTCDCYQTLNMSAYEFTGKSDIIIIITTTTIKIMMMIMMMIAINVTGHG